jgi:hypothetical protein
MTETLVTSLVNQVPSAAAVIVVVMLFLRSLEKRDASQENRDKLFFEQMQKLTERINAMENALIAHDVKMDEALWVMSKMRRRVTDRK